MTEARPPIRPRDDDWPETRNHHREQGDEIARLREALRVALEALEPFAAFYWRYVGLKPFECDRARAAIAAIKEALAAAQEDSRE